MACCLMRACSFGAGSKGAFERAVGHQLDGLEQAAATDVADMRVLAERRLQPLAQARALARDVAASRSSRAITCCTASAAAQATAWPR